MNARKLAGKLVIALLACALLPTWASAAGLQVNGIVLAEDTLAPGDAQIVQVTVNGDTASESDEEFFLDLSNPVGGTILIGQGTAFVLNDDLKVFQEDGDAQTDNI